MSDFFLKIDGIAGEATDAVYRDWIDVAYWAWGGTQTGKMSYGGGGGAGKAQFEDFRFTMRVNKASPHLIQACSTGRHIKQAVLIARKAGGVQEPFLKVTMQEVLVSAYDTGGTSDDQNLESCNLNFARVLMEYREQLANGKTDGPIRTGWDLKRNAAI